MRQSPEEAKAQRKRFREANKERLKAQRLAWRLANPEKYLQRKRDSHARNRESNNASCRAYNAKNATQLNEKRRNERASDPSLAKAKDHEYYVNSPHVFLLKGAKKRAKERNLPFAISAEDIKAAIANANGVCPITQLPFQYGEGRVGPTSMTLDRIDPVKGYVPGNIAVISHAANTMKQNCTDPEVFRRLAAYLDRNLK